MDVLEFTTDSRWITDFKKRKLEKEFVNLVQFERYFGHLSRREKAAKMGASKGYYNAAKKKHGLNKGGKNEEIINSPICQRRDVLNVWSYFIC